jgi:hypothetical protein
MNFQIMYEGWSVVKFDKHFMTTLAIQKGWSVNFVVDVKDFF